MFRFTDTHVHKQTSEVEVKEDTTAVEDEDVLRAGGRNPPAFQSLDLLCPPQARPQTDDTLLDISPRVSEDGGSLGLGLSSTEICVTVLLSVKSVRLRLL